MTTDIQGTETVERPRTGRAIFYHPNGKGTGMALQLELRINRGEEQNYDCFFLEMAHQKTASSMQNQLRQPATFDWENKATVKLSFRDICELQTVLEGFQKQAGNGQNGIYHQTESTTTLIGFKKSSERKGYLLGLSRKSKGGRDLFNGHILLNEAEATGLRCLFQTALFYMVFHASIRT